MSEERMEAELNWVQIFHERANRLNLLIEELGNDHPDVIAFREENVRLFGEAGPEWVTKAEKAELAKQWREEGPDEPLDSSYSDFRREHS